MSEEKKNNEMLEEELEEDFVVELTDEEGKTEKFTILDSITYKDEEFAVLATEAEPDSVVILKYIEEGEEGTFVTVDDDETLQAVFDIFVESLGDGCCCGCEDGCDCGCDCDGDCDCEDDGCDCGCHCDNN